MASWLQFLQAWVKDPVMIGSIAPTSKHVALKVTNLLGPNVKTVVEYGPGNGAVTIPLLQHLAPDATLYVIERNPDFVKALSTILDRRLKVVHGEAQDTAQHVQKPDVILSALPFAFFPDAVRREILASTAANMRPDTKFIVYLQYSRVLEPLLNEYFSSVEHDFEMRNLPPAHLYTCSGPRAAS
jgi:phospholipid N-methyltransferase